MSKKLLVTRKVSGANRQIKEITIVDILETTNFQEISNQINVSRKENTLNKTAKYFPTVNLLLGLERTVECGS